MKDEIQFYILEQSCFPQNSLVDDFSRHRSSSRIDDDDVDDDDGDDDDGDADDDGKNDDAVVAVRTSLRSAWSASERISIEFLAISPRKSGSCEMPKK